MTDPESSQRAQRNTRRRPGSKDHSRPIRVLVTDEQRAELEARAAQAGLPVSTFLRRVGLAQQIKSVHDYESVMVLAKWNADLGRLGGLLKLWLSQKRGQGASVADVNSLLVQIRELIALGREHLERR